MFTEIKPMTDTATPRPEGQVHDRTGGPLTRVHARESLATGHDRTPAPLTGGVDA